MRSLTTSLAAVVLTAFSAGSASAQEFSSEDGSSPARAQFSGTVSFPLGSQIRLARTTIDTGGAQVAGGGLGMVATVGQSEIGIATDGGLRLTAGFHRPTLSAGPIADRIFSDRFSSDP